MRGPRDVHGGRVEMEQSSREGENDSIDREVGEGGVRRGISRTARTSVKHRIRNQKPRLNQDSAHAHAQMPVQRCQTNRMIKRQGQSRPRRPGYSSTMRA